MANFVQGEWDFPVEDQGVFVGAERKKKLADMLRQQSTTPQGQMVGGVFVAPSITQYLASGLNSYNANKLNREADKEVQDVYTNRANTMKTAAQRYADMLKPKEAQVGEQNLPYEASQMDQFGSPMQGQVQGTKPIMEMRGPTPQDMFNAQFQYAQDVNDPRLLMNAANARMNYDVNQQTRQDERAYRSQEAQLQREQRMQELQMRLQDAQLSREQNAALRREMAQLAQANRQQAQPYFQAVPTSQCAHWADGAY
jgi:hypothetical protein